MRSREARPDEAACIVRQSVAAVLHAANRSRLLIAVFPARGCRRTAGSADRRWQRASCRRGDTGALLRSAHGIRAPTSASAAEDQASIDALLLTAGNVPPLAESGLHRDQKNNNKSTADMASPRVRLAPRHVNCRLICPLGRQTCSENFQTQRRRDHHHGATA